MRIFKQTLLATLIIFTLSSCGGYYNLLKSNDSEKKYTEGLKYFYHKEYNRALTLFGEVAAVYDGSLREDTIMFYMAKSLYSSYAYDESKEMMNTFRNRFRRSPFVEEAEYIYAMCSYNMSGTYERDQSTSFTAIQAFTEYLTHYPESIKKDDIHAMIDELSRKIYMKRYNNAAVYYKLGKYNSAITTLRSTLKEYPEIPFKEDIMYLICKSWFDYAENSVQSAQLDRYMNMMDSYYSYKGEFTESSKRLKELETMFEKSKKFTEEHGYQAKAISRDKVDIEQRMNRVSDLKDRRFSAGTRSEKNKITEEIKYERELLKKDRQMVIDNKKEMKYQANLLKEQQKQEKAAAEVIKNEENTEKK